MKLELSIKFSRQTFVESYSGSVQISIEKNEQLKVSEIGLLVVENAQKPLDWDTAMDIAGIYSARPQTTR